MTLEELQDEISEVISDSLDMDWSPRDGAAYVVAIPVIAEVPAMVAALIQYRDDMRHPPAADSRERRIAMIEGILARIDQGAVV